MSCDGNGAFQEGVKTSMHVPNDKYVSCVNSAISGGIVPVRAPFPVVFVKSENKGDRLVREFSFGLLHL